MTKKKPFMFDLMSDGMDLHFIRLKSDQDTQPTSWGLFADLDYPEATEPWRCLIFVRADISEAEIMDEINNAQTYWREQTEPVSGKENSS